MNDFIGRSGEIDGLKDLLQKRSSSLVVIKGRRRIGKSRLAQEFGRYFTHAYFFSGLPPLPGVTAQHQKKEFKRLMKKYEIFGTDQNDWGDLFHAVAEKCQKGKVLVLLDEISWMGKGERTFLGKLKNAWDLHFKKNPHLVLILSGSQPPGSKKTLSETPGFWGEYLTT